jgi:hypothetical protein
MLGPGGALQNRSLEATQPCASPTVCVPPLRSVTSPKSRPFQTFQTTSSRASSRGPRGPRRRGTPTGGDTDFPDLTQYVHDGGVFSVAMCAEMKFWSHFTVTCGIVLFGRPLASRFYRAYSPATGLGVQCTPDCPHPCVAILTPNLLLFVSGARWQAESARTTIIS